MSRMVPRRAARVDESQPGIVKALENLPGCSVTVLGYPVDILVGFRGCDILADCKTQHADRTEKDGYRRKGRVTPRTKAQEDFVKAHKGSRVRFWTTPAQAVAEVLAAVGPRWDDVAGLNSVMATRTNAAASRGKPAASASTAGPEAPGNQKPCPRCINSPHTPEG